MPIASSRSPGYPRLLSELATNQKFPRPPLLRFNNFLEWLTEARKTVDLLLPIYYKNILKDTNEQQDEEIHGSRSRRVPRAGVSVPSGVGVYQVPGL